MKAHKISDNIYAIHANVITDSRFEGIWPIPQGVSLNSYLIKGEKTALVDLAKDWAGSISQFEQQLKSASCSFETIDYLILNHLEPDHTAFITEIKKINPHIEIIATSKGIAMVRNFFKISDNLREVKTGDFLDLGNNVKIDFYETPNIHWPETMMSYESHSKTLFTCDAFGSYGALGDRIFDDEFDSAEHSFFEKESLRYYSNIVSSFSLFVNKALDKLSSLEVKIVAPSHGIIWRTKPSEIITRYARYAGYNTGQALEKEICVIWGSMYGYTKAGVDAVIAGIERENIPYTAHQIPDTDASFVLADAYKSAGLVLAMPTYEYKMFPPMAHILDLFERKHFINKTVLRIGSWGWVGGAKKEYESKIETFKWTSIESVEWQGLAAQTDLELLTRRGQELAQLISR